MVYTRPVPNTDPNNFGTVDVTLDPSMSAATIQTKINQAGTGGVVEWAGSSHYLINTSLNFLQGQKHFTNNNRIVKCTNTTGFDHFINLKPNGTDVTISDLEFWGHPNVPQNPPSTAPSNVIVVWSGLFLRRVKVKGGRERGLFTSGDHVVTDMVWDTIEVAWNVHMPRSSGRCGGWKVNEFGVCGTPVGEVLTVKCSHVHHNQSSGGWFDIASSGVAIYASEFDNNDLDGIFWEVSGGPVLFRDNHCHDNQRNGIQVISGATGQIINNTLGSNAQNGIRIVEDTDPPSRTSLYCPALAQAGQLQGYHLVDWDVLGNVLAGDTVNSTVTSDPAINYSTTSVQDEAPLNIVTSTNTVLPVTPVTTSVFPIPSQINEVDSVQPVLATKTYPVTNPVNLVQENDIPLELGNPGASVIDIMHVGSGFTYVPTYRKTLRLGTVVK